MEGTDAERENKALDQIKTTTFLAWKLPYEHLIESLCLENTVYFDLVIDNVNMSKTM